MSIYYRGSGLTWEGYRRIEEERRQREEQERRRREDEAATLRAYRQQNRLCLECGAKLGFWDRLGGGAYCKRHRR